MSGVKGSDSAPGPRQTVAQTLRSIDLLQSLDEMAIDRLAAVSYCQSCDKNQLTLPCDDQEEAVLVAQGTVQLSFVAHGEELVICLLGSGDFFTLGQREPVLLDEPLATAVVVGTMICRTPFEDFLACIAAFPPCFRLILVQVLRRFMELGSLAGDLHLQRPPARLRHTIWRHAGRNREKRVWYTHELLARLSGMSRETATRLLGDFEQRGLIERERHHTGLVVPDMERLLADDREDL